MNIIEYDAKSASQYIDDLKYWSNCLGELHYHGKCDIEQNEKEEKLPPELLRAYNELWSEDTGSLCYLTEYKGEYKIALINEFDEEFASIQRLIMPELFERMKEKATELSAEEEFANTTFLVAEGVGFEECHELVTLLPCDTPKELFDKIAAMLYENVYKFDEPNQERE